MSRERRTNEVPGLADRTNEVPGLTDRRYSSFVIGYCLEKTSAATAWPEDAFSMQWSRLLIIISL
jgi:hypothetical protein